MERQKWIGSDKIQAEMLKGDTDLMPKTLEPLSTELWINEEVPTSYKGLIIKFQKKNVIWANARNGEVSPYLPQ